MGTGAAGFVPPRPDGRAGGGADPYRGRPQYSRPGYGATFVPSTRAPGRIDPRGWNKFVAIVGIVTGFFFLLTIPGWIALTSYRRWKRGETTGRGLLVWGYIAIGIWILAFLAVVQSSPPS